MPARRRTTRRAPRTTAPVLTAAVLASVGVAGGVLQVVRASQATAPVPAPAASPATTASTASTAAPSSARPATAADPATAVRRAPVGPPRAYRGGLLGVPAPAITAYQRAATIIDTAAGCGLDWTVLAAVARVESDHGRGLRGGHRVGRQGRVRPDVVAASLDGRGGRGALPDTDRGELDRDRRWDAPVGPLGLLPSIWSRVAVDADDDGTRSPQDVDDAALGAAVLLCSGRDLSTRPALRAALRSYHRAPGFVRTVLALIRRYDRQQDRVPPPPPVSLPLPVLPPGCGCGPAVTRDAAVLAAMVALSGQADAAGPIGPAGPAGPASPVGPAPGPRPTDAGPSGPRPTGPTTGPTGPTTGPTESPSELPSELPTESPTESPTETPTTGPTDPTDTPTDPTAPADPSPQPPGSPL